MADRPYWTVDFPNGWTGEELAKLGAERQKEVVTTWFHQNFEDPAQSTPHDSSEGGYQFVWGGPYDAEEVLWDEFGPHGIPEDVINDVVRDVTGDGIFDWAPTHRRVAVEVELGDEGFEEDTDEASEPPETSLDEYFAAHQKLRVVYQTASYLLPQIVDLISPNGKITLRPEYQRRIRWNEEKQSALIESMLLNIPIPPIYLYENEAARYEVMDGQQRLNAIREFRSGQLKLKNLRILRRLNGLTYSECPQRVVRALDRASVSAIVLLLESDQSYPKTSNATPNDLRRRVFDRLNTGGINLNAHEIRNAMNPGPLNEALVRMSRLPAFTRAFRIPPYDPDDEENEERVTNTLYSKMADCELALRFVALRDESNIRGAMRDMLDRAMEQEVSEQDADALVEEFGERLEFLSELFDNRPFQIPTTGGTKSHVYAAMYDAAMTALDRCWDRRELIQARTADIRRALETAFEDEDSRDLLRATRNTAGAVRDRIALFENLLLGPGS